MNQKELYIQYLEDALNHAKTGEPMKHWQIKTDMGVWIDQQYLVCDNLIKMGISHHSIRIKPEPFKWTTFAYRTSGLEGVAAWLQHGGHYNREELSHRARVPIENILTIHHHEVEIPE